MGETILWHRRNVYKNTNRTRESQQDTEKLVTDLTAITNSATSNISLINENTAEDFELLPGKVAFF